MGNIFSARRARLKAQVIKNKACGSWDSPCKWMLWKSPRPHCLTNNPAGLQQIPGVAELVTGPSCLWPWQAYAGGSSLAMFIHAASFTFPSEVFGGAVVKLHNFQGCLWAGSNLGTEACTWPTSASWELVLPHAVWENLCLRQWTLAPDHIQASASAFGSYVVPRS